LPKAQIQKVKIFSLGCRTNQYDTERLREGLHQAGYEVTSDDQLSDIYILNTCTVTARSDHKARKIIRNLAKSNPNAAIIVTGCYAERSSEILKAMPGVQAVIGVQELNLIIPWLLETHPTTPANIIESFENTRTRQHLKIQDGCDNACAYCIVPSVRGKSRLSSTEQIISEASQYLYNGVKELVITGIHIGQYPDLAGLIRQIADLSGNYRIRLSSLDPWECTLELIEIVANHPKVCPHFHLPLQTADPELAKKMNRHASGKEFREAIELLLSKNPLFGLGADVIAGLPGESEESFQYTYKFLQEMPVSYLHVFPFSARPNTAAEKMTNQVPPSTIDERAAAYRELGNQKNLAFRKSLIGKTVKVLIESNRNNLSSQGLTEHYVRCVVTDREFPANTFVNAIVIDADECEKLIRAKQME
jgi:threonylcarbamoyladenosine tRNA methylthiotransferase MtaB